jgi:hypothetical protein
VLKRRPSNNLLLRALACPLATFLCDEVSKRGGLQIAGAVRSATSGI